MSTNEVAFAVKSAWLIVSAVVLAALAMPFVFPEAYILRTSGAFQLPHEETERCLLCGMTRAFLAISRGDLSAAIEANRWSIELYALLWVNELFAAVALALKMRNGFTFQTTSAKKITPPAVL